MFDKLDKKLFEGKKTEPSNLTPLFQLMKEMGAFGDILGREFEVYDKKGNLQYKVVQKPIRLNQLNIALEELQLIHKLEEQEAKLNKPKK